MTNAGDLKNRSGTQWPVDFNDMIPEVVVLTALTGSPLLKIALLSTTQPHLHQILGSVS